MSKIVKSHQAEQMIEQYSDALHKTFDEIPILMIGDFASVVKDTTDKICDEYIKKSDDFKKAWALEIVRSMMQAESSEKGDDNE